MTRYGFVLAIVAMVACFAGCKGEKRPDNFPALVPCSITITQNNAPLTDASIELYSKSEPCPWPVTGTTGPDGKATMVTYGKFQGAPKGTFTVVVDKKQIENEEEYKKSFDSEGRFSGTKKFNVHSLVDPKVRKRETSTLEIKIEGKTDQTLDIGAPAKTVVDVLDPKGV